MSQSDISGLIRYLITRKSHRDLPGDLTGPKKLSMNMWKALIC